MRSSSPLGLLSGLPRDLRLAARSLRRAPGFAAVVVLTLALGIGGTTAVFSVVQAVLLEPLPYEEPGQLVRFYQYDEDEVDPELEFLTAPHVDGLRRRAAAFQDVAPIYTYRETGADLTDGGRAQRLRVLAVGAGYFRTLRAAPAMGREFTPEEETPEAVVVVSHELWRGALGGRPDILGTTLRLSAEPYTVVGVASEGFEDPLVGPVDVWTPLELANAAGESPDNHYLSAVGRLRNGVTFDQARAELASLNAAFAEQWPEVADEPVRMVPLKEDVVGSARGTLELILLAVGLVLLVACVNVANLFLVRSSGRGREFAIRSALGSGGARIGRQLLAESGILAAAGGVVGLVMALLGVDALVALGREAIPRSAEIGFDPAVLGFAALVTLGTGLAFGMVPALRFARTRPSAALREQSRSATGTKVHARLRSGLAVAQLSLALVLLAGAGVLLASFARLQRQDLGFRTEGVVTFDVSLPGARYDAGRRAAFREAWAARLEALPGVTAAGAVSRLPATGTYHSWGTGIRTGPRAGTEDDWLPAEQRVVSGSYFETMGIRIVAGRLFEDRDEANAAPVVVVSESLAELAFPGADPVGQVIAPAGAERTIIGVVEDVALDPTGTPVANVYHWHPQFADDRNWTLTQVVRTDLPASTALAAIRAELATMDPQLVLHRPATMEEVVGRGVSRERFALVLMGAFAAVALSLAALGLYGVLAYGVRLRTRELGIRIALGATGAQVKALVLRQAAGVAGVGVVLGLLGAVAMGRWLQALLFQTNPADPSILAGTALLLTTVALAAAWLPARRAARVEPRVAMQEE